MDSLPLTPAQRAKADALMAFLDRRRADRANPADVALYIDALSPADVVAAPLRSLALEYVAGTAPRLHVLRIVESFAIRLPEPPPLQTVPSSFVCSAAYAVLSPTPA